MTEVTSTQDNFFRGYFDGRSRGRSGFASEPRFAQLKEAPKSNDSVQKPNPPSTSLAQISAQRYSLQARIDQRQSLDLQLVTQDGDTISLQLDVSRSAEFSRSYEQASFSATNGRAGIAALQSQLSQEFAFNSLGDLSIVVNGELDEGELEALQALFEELDTLASTFFSGSIDSAQSQALNFELDFSEFASLDLDLNSQQRFSAVETYQSVQAISGQNQRGSFSRGPTVLEVLDQAEQRIDAFNEQELALTQESRIDLLSLFLTSLEQFLNGDDASSAEVEVTGEESAEDIQELDDAERGDAERDDAEDLENDD